MRLIDADALRENFVWCRDQTCEAYWSDILERLDNSPTVDAVPVVRCSVCSFYRPYTYCGPDGKYWGCGRSMNMFKRELFDPDLYYCAEGDAKDGEAV